MDTLTNQYGFDERIFVSEIPEYFHCTVCSLVLRNPMQILRCGHKMCTVCFDRMKSHSQTNSTGLLCPIDRDIVDLTGVCEDIYLKRVIGNLVVRCYEFDRGCKWTGDLRELCKHVDQCSYKPPQQHSGDAVSLAYEMVNKLTNRVEQCESSLLIKDKEIAMLKHQVQEQQQLNEEIWSLKQQQQQKYESLEEKVSQLVQKNAELEQRQEQQQEHHEKLHQQHHEKHQQQQQHTELLKKHEEEIDRLTKINECQQLEINELRVIVETQQKGISSCGTGRQNISSTSKVSTGLHSSGAATAQKEEPVVVREKGILVELHSGNPTQVTILNDVHSVEFMGTANLSARRAVVPPGSKVWYEVKCSKTGQFSWMRVGWATSDLPSRRKVDPKERVGEDANSYAFSVFSCLKIHNGDKGGEDWGKEVSAKTVVVGVALDLVKREILYSVDGQWTPPMGVAFLGIPADINLFPAFTGTNGTSLQYNFGDYEFTFGPPGPTFMKLLDRI